MTNIPRASSYQSDLALSALALMWGTSHVITKNILMTHSPAYYTSMRFGIASVFFTLMFGRHLRRAERREIVHGILLGLCSFAGIGLYVLGLNFTQASKAGFITGLYLVFTPVLAYLLFRSRPTKDHLVGLSIAVIGFSLLSFPTAGSSVNLGDILIMLAAIAWAAHIAATSAFARVSDTRTLAAVQVISVATLAYSVYFILRGLGVEAKPNQMDAKFAIQIGYMAVLVTFIAALVQTWAQGRVSSTHAAILYTLEPAVAALFAYLWFGEQLGWRQGIGAGLIVLGVLASKLCLASRLSGEQLVDLDEDRPAVKYES